MFQLKRLKPLRKKGEGVSQERHSQDVLNIKCSERSVTLSSQTKPNRAPQKLAKLDAAPLEFA